MLSESLFQQYSENALVRLCLELGAAEAGGPLSEDERSLVSQARGVDPLSDHALREPRFSRVETHWVMSSVRSGLL